jgi:hypothetical protein
MTPAGTIANGTLTMPSGAVQGQTVEISTSQKITAFVLQANAGQTILSAPTTLNTPYTVPYAVRYIMDGANTWHVLA